MIALSRRIPSSSVLIAFEAAARLGSFTEAAEELSISQAAVSRHIRNLEGEIGQALFLRRHRGVELTEAGERLYRAVAMGLEYIARTVENLRASPGGGAITVGATNAVAAFWLLPRLATFRAANPDLTIRVVTRDPISLVGRGGADLAIRYGDGRWSGLEAVALFGDEIFPVCSPAYLAERGPFAPADLGEETLLMMEASEESWIDWRSWFEELGHDGAAPRHSLRFNNYTLAIQAAIDGQGVALGWGRLVHDLVERGHLVRAADASLPAAFKHYLVWAKGAEESPGRGRLKEWILREAEHSRAAE